MNLEGTQGRTLPPCKAVAATRPPTPAQQDRPCQNTSSPRCCPCAQNQRDNCLPRPCPVRAAAELQKLSAHVEVQPLSHHSTVSPERGNATPQQACLSREQRGAKGVGGAPQAQGAGLLLNLRTRTAEAWVHRVRGKRKKKPQAQGQGPESQTGPRLKGFPSHRQFA